MLPAKRRNLKGAAQKSGFKSIKDIVIRGPVEVAESANLSLDEASYLCNIASLFPEQIGVIPNNISNTGSDSSLAEMEYITTGSVELDKLLGGKGVDRSHYRVLRPFWKWENTDLSLPLCDGAAAPSRQ
jgi:hypothetical protein